MIVALSLMLILNCITAQRLMDEGTEVEQVLVGE